jgi:hypothetical protein
VSAAVNSGVSMSFIAVLVASASVSRFQGYLEALTVAKTLPKPKNIAT